MRLRVASLVMAVIGCGLLALAGCESPKLPPPREYLLSSPYAGVRTLAVAPSTNLSPSQDFDPLKVSDQIFEELQQVQGLNVLPVNKTLAAMQKLGLRHLDSVEAAQRLADAMGVDGLVAPVVTAYDPYRPPTIGMVLQLYTGKQAMQVMAAEPEARQVSGVALAGPGAPTMATAGTAQPVSQVEAMFNAHNQAVLSELREFAKGRTNYESALQEERFLADMDAYTRFVAHAMVRRLIQVEVGRVSGR